MADLPEELANCFARPELATVLQQVFEGAEVVGIHPEKALIGIWYGGTGFNVYDPDMWSVENKTGEVYHFNTTDPSRLDDPEENARETLEGYGFKLIG